MKYQCRDCEEWVSRIPAGRFKSGGKKFIDDSGRSWGGYECPDCKFLTNNSPALKIEYKITRNCRGCKKALPPTHYFYHPLCNQIEVPYGEEEYGGCVGRSL